MKMRLAVVVVFLSSPLLARAQTPPAVGRAFDFTDSLGVNTHIPAGGLKPFSAYGSLAHVNSALGYLGFHYVRDGGTGMTSQMLTNMADVARASGIQYDFSVGVSGPVKVSSVITEVNNILGQTPGSLLAVEGSNEVNNLNNPGWDVKYVSGANVAYNDDMCNHHYDGTTHLQPDLYTQVHNNWGTTVPVYSFSVVDLDVATAGGCTVNFSADLTALGDQSGNADFKNLHSYPYEGAAPGAWYTTAMGQPNPVQSTSVVFTETGYSTLAPDAVPYLAVDNTVQEMYELDAVFDLFSKGVKRTFLYELLDDAPDNPVSSAELHFGMFLATGAVKPVANAFHNLMVLLNDAGSTAKTFTPVPQTLTFSQSASAANQDINTFHQLLQFSSGKYVLVLWGEPAIWNPSLRQEITPVLTNTVTIGRSGGFISASVYDPTVGTGATQTLGAGSTLQVVVSDHPIFVEFY